MSKVPQVGDSEARRVVLADDHVIVRHAIRMILQRAGGVEIVGEAGEGDSALELALSESPDVVVLDLNMPGRPAVEVVREIARRRPATAVVALTMEADPGVARDVLDQGARGYLLKKSLEDEFLEALDDVVSGQRYVSSEVEQAMRRRQSRGEDGPPFTERELEVLKLVALGHTNGEIADQLDLSVRTVESHRTRIFQKAPFSTRPELVRYAIDQKLI